MSPNTNALFVNSQFVACMPGRVAPPHTNVKQRYPAARPITEPIESDKFIIVNWYRAGSVCQFMDYFFDSSNAVAPDAVHLEGHHVFIGDLVSIERLQLVGFQFVAALFSGYEDESSMPFCEPRCNFHPQSV